MAEKDKFILLGHGSGGKLSHELIRDMFIRYFSNPELNSQTDSAIIETGETDLAFTTDAFVVDPLFFPGGDIGKLAVAGTVNDLAVSGAIPLFISASFIIEEGFSLEELRTIVRSMAREAEHAGVKIVAGDTKVVNRGKCDKLFISTSGIGRIEKKHRHIGTGSLIQPGDKIIINGSVGDHGMAIMAAREFPSFSTEIVSDCACLNHLIKKAMHTSSKIHFMRDATRGGLATVLAELAENKRFGIVIEESSIPVKENVKGMCELLGYDPLYVANEGKVVMVVDKADANAVIEALKNDLLGENTSIIGEVVDNHPGTVWVNTVVGGKRILDMLAGEQLPRIC
jgi:hydrogenase expression/formation protein HypE